MRSYGCFSGFARQSIDSYTPNIVMLAAIALFVIVQMNQIDFLLKNKIFFGGAGTGV
jgi:hypothetical protein